MNIIKFTDYLKESATAQETQNMNNNDGILIVCDVQKEFDDFIPKNFVNNIIKYCDDFPITEEGGGVYQIWDANKAENFSYNFPNTIQTVKKNYGMNFDKHIKKISRKLEKKYGDIEEGKRFKLKENTTYLVKINNNHKWFYVNEDLVNLFSKLNGKNVIIVGGSDGECIEDVYIAMKSFEIFPTYNHNYIYNAQMSDDQVMKKK